MELILFVSNAYFLFFLLKTLSCYSPWLNSMPQVRRFNYYYLFNKIAFVPKSVSNNVSPTFLFILFLFIFGCVGSLLLRGLSVVAANGGYFSLWCAGFSLRWILLLGSTGSRRAGFSSCGLRASVVVACGLWSAGSVVVAHGLNCSAARGIFPDQGLNPCPLHWQADS